MKFSVKDFFSKCDQIVNGCVFLVSILISSVAYDSCIVLYKYFLVLKIALRFFKGRISFIISGLPQVLIYKFLLQVSICKISLQNSSQIP